MRHGDGDPPDRGAVTPPVVGLLGSEKKFRTFFSAFATHCLTRSDIRTVPLLIGSASSPQYKSNEGAATKSTSEYDRTYPSAWDNVDVLLHKLSDDLAAAGILADAHASGYSGHRELLPCGFTDRVHAIGDGGQQPFYTIAEREAATCMLNAVAAWKQAVPGRVVFEGLDAVSLTTRRTATQVAVSVAIASVSDMCAQRVAVPFSEIVANSEAEDHVLQRLCSSGCHCLVKSDVACGKTATHHMRFVASAISALSSPVSNLEIAQFTFRSSSTLAKGYARANDTFVPVSAPPFPRVVQRVVADAASVVKVYVLGNRIAVRVIRNSIPWIPQKTQETWFSSQNAEFFPVEMESVTLPDDLVIALRDRSYVSLDATTCRALVDFAVSLRHPVVANPEVIHTIVTMAFALTRQFRFCMFGFDLAIGADASTSAAASSEDTVVHVLDVNYFPGYKGIGDVNSLVADLVVRRCHEEPTD